MLSDEAYSRIIFDGRTFYSPATFDPNAFLIYTYGKTLLTPGQRIGYIALSPQMPDRQEARLSLTMMQINAGWAFPNTLLQYAIGDLETLSIDVEVLQARRDRLIPALRDMGYAFMRWSVRRGQMTRRSLSCWENTASSASPAR